MLFGFKTRKELKKQEIADLKASKGDITKSELQNEKSKLKTAKIKWYELLFNRHIFQNTTVNVPANSSILVLEKYSFSPKPNTEEQENEQDTNAKYNATLYCGDDNPYMHLSKKITEGYKYLAVNFVHGKMRFFLNNDNIGMEIDTNNRVRNKTILQFVQDYYSFLDGKVSIFFEKI